MECKINCSCASGHIFQYISWKMKMFVNNIKLLLLYLIIQTTALSFPFATPILIGKRLKLIPSRPYPPKIEIGGYNEDAKLFFAVFW